MVLENLDMILLHAFNLITINFYQWAAILFYAQIIGIAVVAGMYGVPAIQKEDIPTYAYQNAQSTPNYMGLLYGELCCFVY